MFFGFFFGSIFLLYGFAFLVGSRLIIKNVFNSNQGEDYNVGHILNIFFAVITSIFSFG
jgi:hypothetical protein